MPGCLAGEGEGEGEGEAGGTAGWIRHRWDIPWREDVGDEQSVVDNQP